MSLNVTVKLAKGLNTDSRAHTFPVEEGGQHCVCSSSTAPQSHTNWPPGSRLLSPSTCLPSGGWGGGGWRLSLLVPDCAAR